MTGAADSAVGGPVCLGAEGGALDKAAILGCHRADSIVRDAEAVRKAVLGDGNKWSVVLGQSFGGFCLLTYLSYFPGGV